MCVCVPSTCSVNIGCGRAEERFLLTGLHAVADIYCNSCKTTLGWKYVSVLIRCFGTIGVSIVGAKLASEQTLLGGSFIHWLC